MDCAEIPSPPGAPPVRALEPLLEREGMRRRLLLEAHTLTRYAGCVNRGTLRRYVRAIEREPDSRPLRLPPAWMRRPATLGLLEPLSKNGLWAPENPSKYGSRARSNASSIRRS